MELACHQDDTRLPQQPGQARTQFNQFTHDEGLSSSQELRTYSAGYPDVGSDPDSERRRAANAQRGHFPSESREQVDGLLNAGMQEVNPDMYRFGGFGAVQGPEASFGSLESVRFTPHNGPPLPNELPKVRFTLHNSLPLPNELPNVQFDPTPSSQ